MDGRRGVQPSVAAAVQSGMSCRLFGPFLCCGFFDFGKEKERKRCWSEKSGRTVGLPLREV